MIEKEKINWIYKKIFTIRFFEERIKKIAKEKTVPGYLHTCIGSEAICVGVMAALNQDDWISSTYRNHGHAIAKGCELLHHQKKIHKFYYSYLFFLVKLLLKLLLDQLQQFQMNLAYLC